MQAFRLLEMLPNLRDFYPHQRILPAPDFTTQIGRVATERHAADDTWWCIRWQLVL